jgi:hypothetical protein
MNRKNLEQHLFDVRSKDNSTTIPASSSIILSKASGLSFFSLSFKLIVRAKCNALPNDRYI